MQPLIGVTASFDQSHEPPLLPGRSLLYTDRAYGDAIHRAGGVPVLIWPIHDPDYLDGLLERVAGVVLTGGVRRPGASLQADYRPDVGAIHPERLPFEAALVHESLRRGVPLFGICLGLQVLNLVLGGTLRGVGSEHHQGDPVPDRAAHGLRVCRDSVLGRACGDGYLQVNSYHRAAVDQLGAGLVAGAWTEDGIIEWVEHRDRPLLGAQFHPELMPADAAHRAVWQRFLALCTPHTPAGKGREGFVYAHLEGC